MEKINWKDKKNSPELLAFLAQYGNEFYLSAEEVNELKDKINLLVVSSGFYDKLIAIGEITLVGNVITIPANTQWKIADTYYESILAIERTIPYCANGFLRKDILVANTSNNIILVQGTETTGNIVIAPSIPVDTVFITEMDVTDSIVVTPTPPVIGGDFVEKKDLINDLTTGGTTKALTAEMGKTLKALIDAKQNKTLVNVKDYGATGNGITDDTSFINSALTYCKTIKGTLFFPSGQYLTTGNFIIDSKISIKGEGESLNVITDPLPTVFNAGSVNIMSSSATNSLFVVKVDGVSFENLTLSCSAGTTSGAGILFNKGNVMRMNNVGIMSFNVNVDVVNGTSWNMTNCILYDPITYNLIVNHNLLPDGGDQSITNCDFLTGSATGITHLLYKGGGGMKLTSCKFNQGGATATLAKECLKLINDVGVTVDLLISNSSFENYTDRAINLSPVFGFSNVIIDGNQLYGGTSPAIDAILLDSTVIANVLISNNVMSNSTNGIRYLQGDNIAADGNQFQSITNNYVNSLEFSERIIPSNLVIGKGASPYMLNVYGTPSKTVNSQSVAAGIMSEDSAQQGLFFSLKGGASPSDRYAVIFSYENGFGDLPLLIQGGGAPTIFGGMVRLKNYTVSTLPAGTQGDTAFVTDAASPTYLGALTGGGSVKCPVFYNGTAWVSH